MEIKRNSKHRKLIHRFKKSLSVLRNGTFIPLCLFALGSMEFNGLSKKGAIPPFVWVTNESFNKNDGQELINHLP